MIDGYVKWLRSKVGHELIYLVYTIAFVFDDHGKLLVQERYDFDWLSVPGGVLEPHETISQAVIRETYEETGITCTIERFAGVFSHPDYNLLYPNGDRVQPWTAAFVCRTSNSQIQVDGKEALAAQFQPPQVVRSRLPLQYQHALDVILSGNLPFVEPVYYAAQTKPYFPVLRKYVGPANIILPGCLAVIANEQGWILAVHKKQRDIWFLPGGLSDLGETTSGTVVREVREETGLEVEPVSIIGLYSDPRLTYLELSSGDALQTVDLLIECRISGGESRPDGHEIDAVAFKPVEMLLDQPNLDAYHRQLLRDIQNRAEQPFLG